MSVLTSDNLYTFFKLEARSHTIGRRMAQQGNGNSKICMIGNYRFTGKRLGKGNFAKVEEAIHLNLNMKVSQNCLIRNSKIDYEE